MRDRLHLSNPYLTIGVKAEGAELCSLVDAAGTELLWQAGPAWPRHAPILFPIVGRVPEDAIVHRGKRYPLGRHGFARDHRFAVLERSAERCRLVLHDDAGTRAHYPWAFRLEVTYALEDDCCAVRVVVANTGAEGMPMSVGQHPAFAWPLSPDVAADAHTITFDAPEPAPARRLDEAGLLLPDPVPSPVRDRVLSLSPDLFVDDALILDRVASRSVRYGAPGTPTIEVAWSGYGQLGIWSKPGAAFLCIEPWDGLSAPAGWSGDMIDKPGARILAPGGSRAYEHRIRVV